jgi:SRSO17 transposase
MAKADLGRARRLNEYLDDITADLGRVERRAALTDYAQALLLPGERKSVRPLAERIASAPERVEGDRQRLQQAVAVAHWDEETVYRRICRKFLAMVPDVDAVVIDDTGFPKKGKHSPCVQRQYSGTLGRVDNCQVAVSVHLASDVAGACIGMRLFVPESWATDAKARKKTHIPDEIEHQQKWKIALEMLERRQNWGLEDKVVLADSGFGECVEFRNRLQEQGHLYVVAVSEKTTVWSGGRLPTPPAERVRGRGGRRFTRWSRDLYPETVHDVAQAAGAEEWQQYEWTNGNGEAREGVFMAKRIRHAFRAVNGLPPGDEQWLLVQQDSQGQPWKFWLSNLPPDEDVGRLVYLAKLRWRIERDYQEMKGELGLDHFEGRTWHGFHHHCALVAAAHAFLALERALFPPARPDDPAVS